KKDLLYKLLFSILLLVILIFSINAQEINCTILQIIFEENNMNESVIRSGKIDTIRVNDLSGFFINQEIQCDYKSYKIFVQHKFQADFNTARYIDVFIHSYNMENEIVDFSMSYAQRTLDCESDYLVMGNIFL